MKKIIIFFSMFLLLSFGVNAQTLSTDTYNSTNGNLPVVGTNFDVPVNVTAVGEINTFTVYVKYDNTVLDYTGFVDQGYGTDVTNQTPSVLKIIISDFPNPTTISDGKLVDLQFDYLGGYSNLEFGIDSDTYKSSILALNFSTWYFTDTDVTNGAVQAIFDNTISGGDWNDATNWSTGIIANDYANVTVAAGTETTVDAAVAANSVVVAQGGELTLNDALAVTGDFLIESDATGNGSFIHNDNLTVGGTSSVDCYVTNGQWHGIAAPVSGEDFTSMDLGDPIVWVKGYDEANNEFSFIQDINTPMGDMLGWMTWIESSSVPQTFTFEGDFRTGTVGSADNMVRTALGHNFVGNAFTSAIDWEAASGWTKTNLYDAIYVYNNGNWATYINGAGVNDGTQYIAMNQGFFVQVASAGTGTLQMDADVCVHNAVPYLKNQLSEQQTIRLEIEANGFVDESVIRFKEDATVAFDGNMDASKFFSLNESYPQLYSTANNFMSINSLPFEVMDGSVAMDVRGANGNSMTISVVEAEDFEELNLRDEFTGTVTNLKTDSYTFTYNSEVSNRFSLFFGPTGVNEDPFSNDDVRIFAYDKNIQVVLDASSNVNITVYNLMGQQITSRTANSTVTIPVYNSGYYVVKVSDGNSVSAQKVFIK